MGLDNLLRRMRPVRSRTDQQAAFIQAVTQGSGSAFVLKALAGTGKTSTLEMLADDILREHPEVHILYLVYGKKAEQEASARFGKRVRTKTTHAWCLDVLRRSGMVSPLDQDSFKLMHEKGKNLTTEIPYVARWAVRQAAEVACEMGVGLPGGAPDTIETFLEIFRNYPKCKLRKSTDITDAARWARDLFWQSLEVDPPTFGEMLWKFVAASDQITWDSPDVVLVDEVQDWSTVQRLILKKISQPHFLPEDGWPVVAGAGDPNQAIFGWRGADAHSFDHVVNMLGAEVFPLTVSWRCSKAVIAEAQRIVPDIMASDSAEDGVVASLDKQQIEAELPQLLPEAGRTMAIICRNNAPLFDFAIRLVKAGVPMRLRTKEEVVKKIPETVREAYKHADVICDTVPLSDLLRRRLSELEDKPMAAEEAGDEVEIARRVVEAVFDRFGGPRDLDHLQRLVGDVIKMLFRPTSAERHIDLTTIHSAKGLEWDDVVLMLDQLPSRAAKRQGGDALKQELHLLYVAVTRAKHTMVHVSDSDDPLRQILNRFPKEVLP